MTCPLEDEALGEKVTQSSERPTTKPPPSKCRVVTRPTVWLGSALVTRGGESCPAHVKHHISLLRHLPPPLAPTTRVQTSPEASLPHPISHTTLSCCCPLYWACYALVYMYIRTHTYEHTHVHMYVPGFHKLLFSRPNLLLPH